MPRFSCVIMFHFFEGGMRRTTPLLFVLALQSACVPSSRPREADGDPTAGHVSSKGKAAPATEIRVREKRVPVVSKEDGREDVPMEIPLVRIGPGTFRRGSTKEQIREVLETWPSADETLLADEMPARRIQITRPFEISATEIRQKTFAAVMGSNPSIRKGEDLPVHNVLYEEAVEFCARLSSRTGRRYRLPTEAEWEYACRAGSEGLWCFGDRVEELDDYAWFDDNADGIANVAEKKANAWGLFDMHGNVWEWCSDFFAVDAYATGPDADPQGPESGPGHVVRGGSAFDEGFLTRSGERDFGPPFRKLNVGFRVVREP